jgi:hypothetical protein
MSSTALPPEAGVVQPRGTDDGVGPALLQLRRCGCGVQRNYLDTDPRCPRFKLGEHGRQQHDLADVGGQDAKRPVGRRRVEVAGAGGGLDDLEPDPDLRVLPARRVGGGPAR